MLAKSGDLAGRHVVVSAGGTREPIDPVRFISNRSTGKMGYALAEAARDRGAAVTLISTTARCRCLTASIACRRRDGGATCGRRVLDATGDADCLIMAAAVSDFRPADSRRRRRSRSGRREGG